MYKNRVVMLENYDKNGKQISQFKKGWECKISERKMPVRKDWEFKKLERKDWEFKMPLKERMRLWESEMTVRKTWAFKMAVGKERESKR